MAAFRQSEGARGFLQLAAVNVLFAGAPLACFLAPDPPEWLGWLTLSYPVIHFTWSLPWILWAEQRGRKDYASGLKVAAGLSSLAGCVCWGLVLADLARR
jgi:hypothetical protein